MKEDRTKGGKVKRTSCRGEKDKARKDVQVCKIIVSHGNNVLN